MNINDAISNAGRQRDAQVQETQDAINRAIVGQEATEDIGKLLQERIAADAVRNPTVSEATVNKILELIREHENLPDPHPQYNGTTGGGGGASIASYVLTQGEVGSRSLLLPSTPEVPSRTIIHLESGIAQYPNVDFYIDGDLIRWNGLAMELLVEEGQRLHVTYQ